VKTHDLVVAFLNSGRARGLSPRTIAWYEIMLREFVRANPRLPFKPAQVEAAMAGLSGGDESRFGLFRALRVFLGFCEMRYGVASPLKDLTPPKRRRKLPRTLSSQEMCNLFLVRLPARDRALLCLLMDTGVRISEAVRLQADNILQETIVVDGKTGEREVPITQDTRLQLLALTDKGDVFRGRRGHLTRTQAYNIIHDSLAFSGLKGRKLGPHILRHTFGRHFITAGGDLVSLQRILGHASLQSTSVYVGLSMADIIRQHHKFTPIRAALAPRQGRLIDEAEDIIRTMGRGEDQR